MTKTTAQGWIDAARTALVEEGISGVKVDRLASRLGVTRGGFYHNFIDRDDLLDRLLAHWAQTCRFFPETDIGDGPGAALQWMEELVDRLIDEAGYDHRFDMAVREWARADERAANAVKREDRARLQRLEDFFLRLGCEAREAEMRARVFYYHQIGYYALGVEELAARRRRNVSVYLDVLCGADHLAAARAAHASTQGSAEGVG